MTAFLLVWPSPSLAELGDPRRLARGGRRHVSALLAEVQTQIADAIAPLVRSAPSDGVVDRRWYWAAPLFLDQQRHPSAVDLLLAPNGAQHWEGDEVGAGFRAHLAEARAMVSYGHAALGRPPDDLPEVLAEVAVGGPAQCALRAASSAVGLPISDESTVSNAAWISPRHSGASSMHQRSPVSSSAGGLMMPMARPVLSGTGAMSCGTQSTATSRPCSTSTSTCLRDWLGHLNLSDDDQRTAAADDIGYKVAGGAGPSDLAVPGRHSPPSGKRPRVHFGGTPFADKVRCGLRQPDTRRGR